ncbi:hypothetical protein AB4Y36_38240 [Paraburkholderia sp. BR10936]|uniref:hypothetical protein n=1 Tax=Paraburkholderia sp. BR10936 TaxID=3236993 RepID=UPI0034D25228
MNEKLRALLDLFDLLEPSYTGIPSDERLLSLGYARPIKRLPDGRICAIMPMASIDVLAIDINPWGHNDCYYYLHACDAAAKALDAWDGQHEPEGWFRHPPSGRRRRNGDPAQEYYQP